MDKIQTEYDFMKTELLRVQNREFEIFKGRNTILQLMFLSSSGIIAAIGALFRYKGDDDFTLLIIAILIILIPITILYNYLRLVNNTGELSIARIQKFLAQIYLKDYSPDYYPKFDIFPSTGKSYNPISQISGFTPKTMSFYRILIVCTCVLVILGVVASELYIFQTVELFEQTPIIKHIKPTIQNYDWVILVFSTFFALIIMKKLWLSLNRHKEEIENTCTVLLSKFNNHDMLLNRTIEEYFDWWVQYGSE